ncbi:MAG: thiol-disulfide oxidoreductase DCC family protein [Acidimicrobiales bacterium]|nr:thiol-disulfide oxidoreductase DCC family protein [Acidimicrobiales bacterium]
MSSPDHPPHHPASTGYPVVVFDGVCNLCNKAVDLLVRLDRRGRLRFASNQSPTGSSLIGKARIGVDTIYFVEADRVSSESTAVVRIASHLPFPWRLAKLLWVVPRPLRDRLYRLMANNRYRWFGKRETCRLPTPDERSRFLG